MRRLAPLVFAALACVLTAPSPAAHAAEAHALRAGHPRVLATAEDFAALRERRPHDRVLDGMLDRVEAAASDLLEEPVLERKLRGRRLLFVSREALRRLSVLAMAFRTSGDARFAARAENELLAVAAFENWNPGHFLDVAEMAAAVGVGYDWLFDELSGPTRQTLRTALLDKALTLDPETDRYADWRQRTNNWNSVCFGGLALGALAIGDEEPRMLARFLADVREHNPRGVRGYAPQGVYPEGPGYWDYGTTFQVFLISALRSALGEDFGLGEKPGFVASGAFMAHARGPSGKLFNFSDGRAERGFSPALLWIASEADQPAWLSHERDGDWQAVRDSQHGFPAIAPLWWIKAFPDVDAADASPRPALSWSGQGPNPVAFFRERWSDPRAMYLGLKGGRGDLSHGHLDAGSFVFEADGVRWAHDLGSVNYTELESQKIKLFQRSQDGDRWKIYPYRNLAHNTLSLGDQNHRVNATAGLDRFEPLAENQGAAPTRVGRASVDLTAVFGGAAASATRSFAFATGDERGVVIQDEFERAAGDDAADLPLVWTLITHADVRLADDGRTAVLREDGETLRLEMTSRPAGRWTAEPYHVPAGNHGPQREGITHLKWTVPTGPGDRITLKAKLAPGQATP